MVPNLKTLPRHYFAILVLAVAIGAIVWAGCSNDKNPVTPGGPTTTTFTGFFANGTENGSINLTLNTTSLSPRPAAPARVRLVSAPSRAPSASAQVITASGTLKLVGGGTVGLTGTYDNVADSLDLSGSGYDFAGERDTSGTFSAITGQYTGPNGGGYFACATGLTGASTYCGTFDSGTTALTGNWNLVVAGSVIGGVAIPTTADPFAFEGTIGTTGTMRDITAGDGSPGVFLLTITGTLNTTTHTVSGSWTYEDYVTPSTDSGTWTGSLCPQ